MPCPKCGELAHQPLSVMEGWPSVKYYVCQSCFHVWTVGRDGKTITHITPLDPQDPIRGRG